MANANCKLVGEKIKFLSWYLLSFEISVKSLVKNLFAELCASISLSENSTFFSFFF